MKRLLFQIICITEVLLSAADSSPLSEDMLKKLSAAGEQCVDEEIKRVLLGVKRVKETMEKKEEKHRHLMGRPAGASQLVWETELKLQDAEQQCQDVTKSSFEECRACLEDACKAFFTTTCRRGFSSFSFKLEEFLSKIAAQLEATEHLYKNYENMGRTDSPETEDLELLQADASFSQLLSNISLLYNQSIMLVKRKEQVFGDSFLAAFTTESRPSLVSAMQSPGFFTTLGFNQILGSVSDFGKNCPSVQQLHSEVEEMHSLLNASQQQYDDTLQLVQRHTADTQRCLSNMQNRLCWVSQLSNSTTGPHNIFSVITVDAQQQIESIRPKADSLVVVTILDSAPITVTVPAELEVEDPAFIQYVAQEALILHKQQIRGIDPSR
ncbi:Clusterin-like protein 1 [Dissostichus eleginoides]|uniref:Clusterin n=1 Tax=Dissostichus eleginoides TaxID=100907 RepID=A0AAD9BM53_DISEL|nr:Clusterin-like protein 1 [Dissostichus eleginoides]